MGKKAEEKAREEFAQWNGLQEAEPIVRDNLEELYFKRYVEADYVTKGDTASFMEGYTLAMEDLFFRLYGKNLGLRGIDQDKDPVDWTGKVF